MKTKKTTLATSDDYAILTAGQYYFYFGYEETIPEKPEEDEESKWAFVAKKGDSTLVRWSKDEVAAKMSKRSRDELWGTESVLLAGIGAFLREKDLDDSVNG
jgi:hypothetical protein